jgi:NCS1 family nucleobase:cation symporter-1
MFVGITGITMVDYFVLRRERLAVSHLFTRSTSGTYWYWAGVNWGAVFVAIVATVFYLTLYDPSSYRVAPAFRFLGAGIPTMLLAGVAYFLLARYLLGRLGKGGYAEKHSGAVSEGGGNTRPVEVSL